MKVLHLDTEKGFRGGEQQLIYLAQGLKEQGIESIIACKDELYSKANALGFKAIKSNNVGALIKAANACDLLHAHASKAHTLGIILKLLTKKPLVYTRRVDYRQNKISKIKYILTDSVVCVSKFVCHILYENYNNSFKSQVIYSAVDFSLLNKIDYQKVEAIKKQYGPVIIGNIGALTTQKDHKTLIDAACLLNKQYTFLILGKGALENRLKNYTIKKGVAENFHFLGFKDDIQNYLAAFDLFAISSEYEGLCSSILQAFLFRVPVVTTNAGGIGELIGANKRGLIVPIKNAQALANSIGTMLKNKDLSTRFVNEAYNFVQNFNYAHMSKRYIAVYEKLI